MCIYIYYTHTQYIYLYSRVVEGLFRTFVLLNNLLIYSSLSVKLKINELFYRTVIIIL